MPYTEADTCRELITPQLQAAGWDTDPHAIAEQQTFTAGRIQVLGTKTRRGEKKRADYLLFYRRNLCLAVVEAKAADYPATSGMQQAKDYAQDLALQFAYATNGREILEFDFATGKETPLPAFPTPAELWARQRSTQRLPDEAKLQPLLEPYSPATGKNARYYQETAINRTVAALLRGQNRVLLTMATGTGKTFVAFQICWKLWSSRWNRTGEHRHPRILYLADRNILIDDPKDKMFAPFGDARWKIENGEAQKGREMYFSTYQSIAKDERRPGLYREYARDFFDLVVVDECHRGSAKDASNWREILEHFEPAYQLGMTATPLRDDNRDTYRYFGSPIYQYSLKQGIDDGFLAPYQVHRVITSYDAAGWRPTKGQVDRLGREIPDGEYHTKDFERVIALKVRTEAIARHLADFMAKTDRFAKTIVFCVDQEHAGEMRRALANANQDLVQQHPDYACQVTASEGDIGRGHLSKFQELETTSPVILTTSQLLTTGVDAPTCKNVVLARVVNSMTEFKQIIGRGTRVRDDYGKLYFRILDYTGSATRLFADPDFDGSPVTEDETHIDDEGKALVPDPARPTKPVPVMRSGPEDPGGGLLAEGPDQPRKFYVDGGQVTISNHLVYELDAQGNQLRVVEFTQYAGDRVRTLFRSPDELLAGWLDPELRQSLVNRLEEVGIDFETLQAEAKRPDADAFDLLCHVAFESPLRTRRERADQLCKKHPDFFTRYQGTARQILTELVEKYADHGTDQLKLPDVLKVPPLSEHGTVIEIAQYFGGPEHLRAAVQELHRLLYAA